MRRVGQNEHVEGDLFEILVVGQVELVTIADDAPVVDVLALQPAARFPIDVGRELDVRSAAQRSDGLHVGDWEAVARSGNPRAADEQR